MQALERSSSSSVQEIFENETTKFADVVLPASAFLEKAGTFTNAERRFQLVEPAVDPPGEAKTDLEIITLDLDARSATSMPLDGARGRDGRDRRADAARSPASPTSGIGRHGLQWPVAADGTDSPILYEERVRDRRTAAATSRRCRTSSPATPPSDEFPLILVTGRRLEHYNAGTMTRRTANLELVDRDWLEIHPDDAERLWITDGERVSVRSRVGRIEIEARVTERIEPGHVFTAFHFPEVRTNLLVGSSADVNTSCPEYKVVAVDVRPVAEQPAYTPALAEPVAS